MTRSSGSTQKITVNLPRPLIQRLRQQIPSRQRAEFVAQALEDRLALAEQVEALEETAGAWRDADHPDLQTPDDIDRWLTDLRGSWPARLTQLQSSQT